ncbi:hypothetical protein O7626_29755 [Micromonospora sp. WMMD1102]|uniref:hypothetical protein n=1 Tax=Micromonospora sp. WMMD1102 TaxID=3016105 RepID=UPI0024156CA8|nr:hypothetical protein [Micromonospora sp. WMMD1102]MDG4790057.1 hypothetical protein [Micromonospora sp. WMMD1102]
MVWSTGAYAFTRSPLRPSGRTNLLDRTSLADAFEAACLIRCIQVEGVRQPATLVAEFSSEAAATRLAELLVRLGMPARPERITAGVRRRYELHRLHLTDPGQPAVLAMGWRQGRTALLDPAAIGASAPRNARRQALAAAAWRAALLAAGRHVRTTILGVRIRDTELAAVLVRGAQVLGSPASVAPRSGCLLVTVPGGPDKDRILRRSAQPTVLVS